MAIGESLFKSSDVNVNVNASASTVDLYARPVESMKSEAGLLWQATELELSQSGRGGSDGLRLQGDGNVAEEGEFIHSIKRSCAKFNGLKIQAPHGKMSTKTLKKVARPKDMIHFINLKLLINITNSKV